MKRIFIVRHAKSDWRDQSLVDFDRPLSKRGKMDAPIMGELLNEKIVHPDLIISSPAKRAKKTATIVAAKIGYSEKIILLNEELYEASSNTLLKLLKNIDEKYGTVMLFGHNPGLTLLNNYLSDNYIENIPTCGIVALEFDGKWNELDKQICKNLFFIFPKLYK